MAPLTFHILPFQVHALHDLRGVPGAGHRRVDPVLDRVLQLDAEPADLRVLQPGLPGGVPQHAALPVLQLVEGPPPAAGHRHPALQPALRPAGEERLLGELPQLDDALAPPPVADGGQLIIQGRGAADPHRPAAAAAGGGRLPPGRTTGSGQQRSASESQSEQAQVQGCGPPGWRGRRCAGDPDRNTHGVHQQMEQEQQCCRLDGLQSCVKWMQHGNGRWDWGLGIGEWESIDGRDSRGRNQFNAIKMFH